MSSKAVFLDRDGVLIQDKGYVFRNEDLEFLPGVEKGLETLKDRGFKLLVITNQSGVARGLFKEEDVVRFHDHLNTSLSPSAKIDKFYYCPHHPSGSDHRYTKECDCRKPGTDLLYKAQSDFEIGESVFVGDKKSDIECAHKFGIKGIFIESRYGTCDQADYQCRDFTEAVATILSLFPDS